MSDDPLNVTSPTVNMTTAADPITSSNGNMTSGDDSATLNTTSETSQQAYDLSKLDNATLEQLISSVCSLCSGDVTVTFSFLFITYVVQVGGWGQQHKRSHLRAKPKKYVVFFVLFQNTYKFDVLDF